MAEDPYIKQSEEAELEAQKAQAALAQTTLSRLETLSTHDAVAQEQGLLEATRCEGDRKASPQDYLV